MATLEFTRAEVSAREHVEILFPALTIQVALYAALAFAAFALRLFLLDAAPLNSDEARQALASWNFVRGIPDSFTGSPLLFTGNAILFTLFGASDAAARWLPALFGSALTLLPVLLRRDLGRTGALIASALLAFSPSLVFFSRNLDGTIIAMSCALAALAFAWRFAAERSARFLYFASLSAALALLSAREVWTVVVASGFFLLMGWSRLRYAPKPSSAKSSDGPLAHSLREENYSRPAAILFILVFVGVATTFLLHHNGIGAAFDLFGAWLDGLRPGGSPFELLRLLFVYEPILFLCGVAALVEIGLASKKTGFTFLIPLALWAAIAFLLYSFGADTNPGRIVAVIVPLTLLAGWFIGAWLARAIQVIQEMPAQTFLTQEVPLFLIASGLAAFLYFVIAEFITRGGVLAADVLTRIFGARGDGGTGFDGLIIALLVVAAFIAVATVMLTTVGTARAKNLGIAFALAVLAAWSIRQNAILNFSGALNAQEGPVERAASPNVRDLVHDLEDISRWRADDTHTLAMVADKALGPLVEWDLRQFVNARFVSHPTVAPETQALLLPANAPAPATGWISQRYRLEIARGASPSALFLRWLIFRDVGNVEFTDAVLWIPKPQ